MLPGWNRSQAFHQLGLERDEPAQQRHASRFGLPSDTAIPSFLQPSLSVLATGGGSAT